MPKIPLSKRDDDLRRVSHYPVGHFGPVRILHLEDEERTRASTGVIPRLGVGHQSHNYPVRFRKNDERKPGRNVTELLFPVPPARRPKPGASPEEITAWNAFMTALPQPLRLNYMGVPVYWIDFKAKDPFGNPAFNLAV
jgi:hypothetical protein